MSTPASVPERASPTIERRATPAARYVLAVWIVVLAAALVRLMVAARLPLSGDEAYYWEWSRRLAFGYFDHPPMVAWLIALFSFGAKSTLLIRLPFVLCGVASAAALFAFASRAAGDPRAGATAALLLTLAPFATVAFTAASPDGPFLLFWSLSLYLALRALDAAGSRWRIPLALAVAGAALSRVLGLLLAAGVAYALALGSRAAARKRPGLQTADCALIAVLVFTLAMAPYLIWNASQRWAPLLFALSGRHSDVSGAGAILPLLGLYAVVLTPGIFVAVFPVFGRLARQASLVDALLLATTAPLLVISLVLVLRERVEFYWADGSFVSLIAALGIYAPLVGRRVSFALVLAPAAVMAILLFVIAAAPLQIYQFAQKTAGVHLRHSGPFEIWAFEPAARDVARAAAAGEWVMTDGYGLSSVLDFYGGVSPVVIGYDQQGREARKWLTGRVPASAIFFDKEPLRSRPDFQRQLARACAVVKNDGERSYYVEGVLARTFYLTRCVGLSPAGFSLLLWGDGPPNG